MWLTWKLKRIISKKKIQSSECGISYLEICVARFEAVGRQRLHTNALEVYLVRRRKVLCVLGGRGTYQEI